MVEVKVYIYDISKGLARGLSQSFLGKQIDGVWHTGIVVFGQEYFFGGMEGIASCDPGTTILGAPDQIVNLGTTEIPFEIFMDHLSELSQTSFRPEAYELFHHNCNNFSDEVAHFLTGNNIPGHITALPQEVLNTPFGGMIAQFMNSTQVNPGGGHSLFPTSQSAPSEPPKPQSTPSSGVPNTVAVSSAAATSVNTVSSATSDSKSEVADTVTFKPDKVSDAYQKEKANICASMNASDRGLLDEVNEYINLAEPMWSLSREHFKLLARLLQLNYTSNNYLIIIGDLLIRTLLIDDALMVLKHDTECTLQKLLASTEELPTKQREIVCKSVCNVCSSKNGFSWLSSTNSLKLTPSTSNNKLLMNSCVSSLLADEDFLVSIGAALSTNICVFTNDPEVTSELGPALIQTLMVKELGQETASRCLQALTKCVEKSPEVAGIAAVMGLSLDQEVFNSNHTLKSLTASVKEKMASAQ